jgi:hypothetical protein
MNNPRHETDDDAAARAVESLDLRDAMIAGLAAGANDLVKVAHDLYKVSMLSRVEKVVAGILLAGLAITSVTSLVLLFRLNGVTASNRQNTTIIKDCTDPTGTCFKEAQARTAAAVAQLNSTTIIAVECADAYDGQAAINACIVKRIHP